MFSVQKDGSNAEKRKVQKQLPKSIKKLQKRQEEALQVVIYIDQQVVATYGDSLPAMMFSVLHVVPSPALTLMDLLKSVEQVVWDAVNR